jgi:lactoylglutathione lyase
MNEMIHKIEHIGVKVINMDKSVEFYTNILGMKLVDRVKLDDGVELGFLSLPGDEHIQIELIGRGADDIPQRGKVDHIAFTVSDIDAEAARLKDAGVNVLDDAPRTILGGVKIFFFTGPDGEVLELFQPLK